METNLLSGLNQTLFPGHRVIRVNGWDEADKYPLPRDCEAIFIDKDPESDHIYMKMTDSNGGSTMERYKIQPDPIPRFDPDKYITVESFKSFQDETRKFQEEILDAIHSLTKSNTAAADATRSGGHSNEHH